ncbi:MAG: hypothetical protein M3R38_19800 [Actinomycetota bacterium]|nr:hypothetical protein [Actinomycetota bacterium]
MGKPRAGKKSAKDSLAKLSKGLTRETPATRAGVVADGAAGAGNGTEDRPAAEPVAKPGAEGASPRRGRPRTKVERKVRVSVDVPRARHKYLRDFAYDAEADGMSVVNALLAEMEDDPVLEERVRERLGNLGE